MVERLINVTKNVRVFDLDAINALCRQSGAVVSRVTKGSKIPRLKAGNLVENLSY